MTGMFLLDFSVWFCPDRSEFSVGIYVQAWLSLCTSPNWFLSFLPFSPHLPPVLSLHARYQRNCSKAWSDKVTPLPETFLNSPVPKGTDLTWLLGVTFSATWPSSTHPCAGEGLESLRLLTLCCWLVPLSHTPGRLLLRPVLETPPPPLSSYRKRPQHPAQQKVPGVSSRHPKGKQDKAEVALLAACSSAPSHSDMLCDPALRQGHVYQPMLAQALTSAQVSGWGQFICTDRRGSLGLISRALSPGNTLTIVLTLCFVITSLFHVCLLTML